MANTFELRFPLFGDSVGGVLFHDAGNVYTNIQDLSFRFRQRNLDDFDYMVQSVGFGIRYRTPIGPLRVDVSFSPDAPRFFGQGNGAAVARLPHFGCLFAIGGAENQRLPIFFHFSLGQAF